MGIKAIAKAKNDVATVKLLVKHPMQMENKEKNQKPKFIEQLTVTHGGKTVYSMYPSMGVSKNPYIKFMLKGAKSGDTITVMWKDNTGESETKDFKLR